MTDRLSNSPFFLFIPSAQGGYNIKTGMMELMKFDCGGAAAVLGAARAVGALKPPGVECHFVVAACENMINEKGVVPSDILTASNGKTIEVLNTDAEVRLLLNQFLSLLIICIFANKTKGSFMSTISLSYFRVFVSSIYFNYFDRAA